MARSRRPTEPRLAPSRHRSSTGREVATEIVIALADRTGLDVDDLPPLYRAIDPDALNAVFADGARADADVAVTFEYAGHRVVVTHEGFDLSPLENRNR